MADKSTTMPANSLSSLINSVRSFATRNPSPDLGDAAPPEDPPSTPPHQQPHPDLQSPQSSILASVRAEMQAHVQELQQEEEQTPDEDTEMQMDPKKQDHHYQIAREDGDEVLQEWPNNPFVSPLRRSFQTYSIGKRKSPPRIISLLTDSEASDTPGNPSENDSDNDSDNDGLMITNVTPIKRQGRRKQSASLSPSSSSSSSASSSLDTSSSDNDEDDNGDLKITYATCLNSYRKRAPSHKARHFQSPKRRRREGEFKTGPWNYKDRMLLVESLQRGIDFITLGQKMRRDVDDVFEKFSDVVAAGLYKCNTKDSSTQTDVVLDV